MDNMIQYDFLRFYKTPAIHNVTRTSLTETCKTKSSATIKNKIKSCCIFQQSVRIIFMLIDQQILNTV